EQRGQPSDGSNGARRGLEDPRHALEQRALPGAVVTEESDGGSRFDAQADVVERLERLVRDAAEVDHPLLRGGVLLAVQLERFGDPFDLHCGCHLRGQSSSVKLPSSRRNTDSAMVSSTRLPTMTITRFRTYHQYGNACTASLD